MDQLMVDVTDIEGVSMNDEVILMGRQGDNEISADFIASVLHTINYEVFCTLSKRVPRQYIKDRRVVKTVKYV
ncbi:alanine racemase 1 [Clostridiales bacterium]|nr:alanine racemase 1 [Clostridiales bacterium]